CDARRPVAIRSIAAHEHGPRSAGEGDEGDGDGRGDGTWRGAAGSCVGVNMDEESFRIGVRTFLEATLPRKGAPAPPSAGGVARAKAFQRAVADAGYAGITWPEAYGGRGLANRFQRI